MVLGLSYSSCPEFALTRLSLPLVADGAESMEQIFAFLAQALLFDPSVVRRKFVYIAEATKTSVKWFRWRSHK